MKPNLVSTMALGCTLLLLPGCGWIGIGKAVDELTDNPEDPTPTLGVLGTADTIDQQPYADRTILTFSFTPNDTETVRMRFEFRAGRSDWTDVPTSSISIWEQNGNTTPLASDSAGNFLLPISSTSSRFLQWDHGGLFGRAEVADVSLRIIFGDASRTPPDQRVIGLQTDVLNDATLGRELGEITSTGLRRGSNIDPESDFRLETVLLDHGGDRDTNEFEIQYAATPDATTTPTEGDYRSIPPEAWDRDDPSINLEPDGRTRFVMQFLIKTIAAGAIPRGGYEQVWIRLRHREVYATGRRGENPTSAWSPWTESALEQGTARVGHTPVIESATIADPSLGDPGRRWPRLPITLTVRNPSPQYPMDIELGGTYRINSGEKVHSLSPFFNGDPRSKLRFRLEPGERATRYLVWNSVLDEGLGSRLNLDPPYSELRVAEVRVRAEALATIGQSLETPLAAELPAGFASLSTSPFVAFRDNLLPEAKRVWSAGSEGGSQGTRDLFFTQLHPDPLQNTQEVVVGLNQQFEAIQLIPRPPEFNFYPSQTNGVFDIAPTNFDPNAPDCLVWINSKFFHMAWPDGGGAVTTPAGAGFDLFNRGNEQVSFELNEGTGTYQAAVFHSWDYATGSIEVRLRGVVRDPAGNWSTSLLSDISFPLQNQIPDPGQLNAVGGEFDGDPTTHELVIGTLGTEKGPGLLHYWSIGLNGTSLVASAPQALPALPDVPESLRRWRMRAWQPDANSPTELIVVREVKDGAQGPLLRFDCHRLRREGSGFAANWEPFGPPLDTENFEELGLLALQKIFTRDLDGSSGGRIGSDLLVVADRRIGGSADHRSLDLWILATSSEGAEWRRLAEDIRALTPDTLEPPPNGGGSMIGGEVQLADVDGDGRLDFITGETVERLNAKQSHFNYFAASLGGVAGRLGDVPLSAGAATTRAVLPGLVDANGDGQDDVVAGTRLHLANVNGGYVPTLAGLSGGPQARHRVERVLLDPPENTIGKVVDVLVAGAYGPVIRVDRLEGIGTPAQSRLIPTYQIPFGTEDVLDARAFMTPNATERGIKDIMAMVGEPPVGELRFARFDTKNATTTILTQLGQVLTETGFALIRRGTLSADNPEGNDLLVQDVVALTQERQLIRFRSASNFEDFVSETLEVPRGEQVAAIAESSLDGDQREDLVVLTKEGIAPRPVIFRIRAFLQGGGTDQPTLLAQFEQPYRGAGTAVRSFHFDRTKAAFAEGFLLLDDFDPTSNRSEIILIRPFEDSSTGALRLRLARSPQSQPADLPFEALVTDNDQDGIIEVIGGEVGGTTGLKRLVTNSESAGN